MPLCEKIGYSHAGMFRLPIDHTHRAHAIHALGIQTLTLKENFLQMGNLETQSNVLLR
jgi:hypothetical protein